MRQLVLCLTLFVHCLVLGVGLAEAAKKKVPTPAAAKAIYEAPMRVVIVRNSSVTCEPNCPQWIAAEGEITGATPALFRKVLKRMGKAKLPVVIRSPGGSINAALEIGKMLRERKMTVAVGFTRYTGCSPDDLKCKLPKESLGIYEGQIYEYGAFCNSACPMLLSGGTTRLASSVAYIGLHEPKTVWTRTQLRYRDYYKIVNGKKKVTRRQILSRKTLYDKTTFGFDKRLRKRLSAYYKSMGVDVAIIDESTKAKYQDINYIADDLKTKLALRTSTESAALLDNPELCGKSASCVEDKTRDPKALTVALAKEKEKESLKLIEKQKAVEKLVGLENGSTPMTFRLVELDTGGCDSECPKMIIAEGRITPTTQVNLVTFLNSVKPGQVPVILNSDGGDLSAALHMAQRIRMIGVATSVASVKAKGQRVKREDLATGTCKGACAVVFAGGVSRHLADLQEIEMFHPDLLAGGVAGKTVQLNSTLAALDVNREFMADLHKLKKANGAVYTAKQALAFQLATQVQPMVFAVESAICKSIAPKAACSDLQSIRPVPDQPKLSGVNSASPVLVFSNNVYCAGKCPAWIAMHGEISAAGEMQVREIYANIAPHKPPLVIDSQGGDLTVAMRLAAFLRAEGISVAIGRTEFHGCTNEQPCFTLPDGINYVRGKIKNRAACTGACVFLLAGGKARISDSSVPLILIALERLNMHSASVISATEVKQFFKLMSLSPQISDVLLDLSGDEQHIMLANALSSKSVINSGSLPDWLDDAERCDVAAVHILCMQRN